MRKLRSLNPRAHPEPVDPGDGADEAVDPESLRRVLAQPEAASPTPRRPGARRWTTSARAPSQPLSRSSLEPELLPGRTCRARAPDLAVGINVVEKSIVMGARAAPTVRGRGSAGAAAAPATRPRRAQADDPGPRARGQDDGVGLDPAGLGSTARTAPSTTSADVTHPVSTWTPRAARPRHNRGPPTPGCRTVGR